MIYTGYPRKYSIGYSRWYSSTRCIYVGYIGGTPYSANSSIGYSQGYCFPSVEKYKLE